MKYADKVIDLLAAYPGRDFVMREIINYVSPRSRCRERMAVKKAVQRVMQALTTTGTLSVTPPKAFGAPARYTWKTGTLQH